MVKNISLNILASLKPIPLAHVSWLNPFVEYFRETHIEFIPYLEAANIEPGLLKQGEGWITKKQLYTFLNNAAEGEDLPELGFVVGDRMNPEDLRDL